MLNLKDKEECRWDSVSLGEVLLRFDCGEERIHNARQFRVWDGGGEYNVARGLAKTFGQRTTIATSLADNALGRLAEELIRAGAVDVSNVLWRETDGRGANTRNGIYYIERGFGLRAPASCFDRANTAVSQLEKGNINWQEIFVEKKSRWFHTGGIFVGLSDTTPEVAREAMEVARENATVVTYDLNYRDSLWRDRGGREAANEINRSLLPLVDIAFGVFDFDSHLSRFDESEFQKAAASMQKEFPNLKIVVSTLREVKSASLHDFSAAAFADGKVYKAQTYENIEVLDRVGSGDAFVSGFIYGFLSGNDLRYSIECGTAHAALAMTTPGDNSMARLSEVESLMRGEGAAAKR